MFNATWISAFVEEDEYLWFGSTHKLSVEGIVIVASTRNYAQSIAALYLFDAALSGQSIDGMSVTKQNLKILDFCLKYIRNEALPRNPKCVDEYVAENMYAFAQSKTKIFLKSYRVAKIDEAFQDLIFYRLSRTAVIPNDQANICRADLFSLFPNMVEVELWTIGHPLNLLSLLSVLEEAVISPSFKRLRIRGGYDYKWIKKAFSRHVQKQFAAKNFVIKMETVRDERGDERDWIVINPLSSEIKKQEKSRCLMM